MSNRISEKDLKLNCEELNNLFGYELECYSKQEDGSYKPNQNVFHIDMAYGGYALSQMSSRDGCTGTSDVQGVYGRHTKRELYNLMRAYIAGIYAQREATK